MDQDAIKGLAVFVATTGDVSTEQRYVREVLEEVGSTSAWGPGIKLDPFHWTMNSYPGYGVAKDAQAILRDQIGDMARYSLFIAILWDRLGTPTPRARSGTVEEFEMAVDAQTRTRKQQPDIWLYFRQNPRQQETQQQKDDWQEVLSFRRRVEQNGLACVYKTPSDFRKKFRMQLHLWLNARYRHSQAPERVNGAAPVNELQSHWLPFLEAAQELVIRFEELLSVYRREWTHPFTPESLSADFRELFVLSRQTIPDIFSVDPNSPRRDERAVQHVRTRMGQELTFVVSSLYITAAYISWAEHVRRDLKELRLIVSHRNRDEVLQLLSNVRTSLAGDAGIINQQQTAIAEALWDRAAGRVIGSVDFRERLLRIPGWDQFLNLLRFFVHFEYKLDHEVGRTISAVHQLVVKLEEICPNPTLEA